MSFVDVLPTDELKPGEMKQVKSGNRRILIVNLSGKLYAIGDVCTHQGCPLSNGTLDGEIVECPCHGSMFDVKTGRKVRGPATNPESTFETKTEGNRIFVKV